MGTIAVRVTRKGRPARYADWQRRRGAVGAFRFKSGPRTASCARRQRQLTSTKRCLPLLVNRPTGSSSRLGWAGVAPEGFCPNEVGDRHNPAAPLSSCRTRRLLFPAKPIRRGRFAAGGIAPAGADLCYDCLFPCVLLRPYGAAGRCEEDPGPFAVDRISSDATAGTGSSRSDAARVLGLGPATCGGRGGLTAIAVKFGKNLAVVFTVASGRLVLSEIEVSQPSRDIHRHSPKERGSMLL